MNSNSNGSWVSEYVKTSVLFEFHFTKTRNTLIPFKGEGDDISNVLCLYSDALLWKFENVLVLGLARGH